MGSALPLFTAAATNQFALQLSQEVPEDQQWVQGFLEQAQQSPELTQCFEETAPGEQHDLGKNIS
jgi:hypothetical protein